MGQVLIALLPGIAASLWWFGFGVLLQIVIALITAELAEALLLWLRQRPLKPFLTDLSAPVTAILLALSLPPLAPWWLVVIGTLFAIIIVKQLFGGLGYNPFNPAMAGYAALLISFPLPMTLWPSPDSLGIGTFSLLDSSRAIFIPNTLPALDLDAITAATPLDQLKSQQSRGGYSIAQIPYRPWCWIAGAYLLGGLWLMKKNVIDWRIPVGLITALITISALFAWIDPLRYPPPLFHLLHGATMLGAFFIATDPVTAATTPNGRLIVGAMTGLLIYTIRSWGGYPDGVAFAVLLMNLAAPTIDHFTRPRVYGEA